MALIVLAGGVAGVIVARPGPLAGWLGHDDALALAAVRGTAEVAPPPVLAAAGNAPVPNPTGVRAAIGPLVGSAALGDRVNAAVTDVTTGQVLYDHGAKQPTTPASVTKLVTAATVLAARGAAYRIPTRAVAGNQPGEVVLVGGGDPTLAAGATGYYPDAARLDLLAAQVKRSLGGTAPTRVIIDASLYSGPAYGRAGTPTFRPAATARRSPP